MTSACISYDVIRRARVSVCVRAHLEEWILFFLIVLGVCVWNDGECHYNFILVEFQIACAHVISMEQHRMNLNLGLGANWNDFFLFDNNSNDNWTKSKFTYSIQIHFAWIKFAQRSNDTKIQSATRSAMTLTMWMWKCRNAIRNIRMLSTVGQAIVMNLDYAFGCCERNQRPKPQRMGNGMLDPLTDSLMSKSKALAHCVAKRIWVSMLRPISFYTAISFALELRQTTQHTAQHRPLEVLEPRNALYLFNVFDFSIFEFNLIYMHHLSTVSTKSVVWSAVASDSFTPVGRHHSFPNSLLVNELCQKPTLWTASAAFAVDRRPWNIFATLQLWKTTTTTELDTS